MASELYAGMFAEAYKSDREKAVDAGFKVPVQSSEESWGWQQPLSFLASLTRRHSHNGRREDSLRSRPTTTVPETPGSMSSEHSFMATSAPAPQPPPLAAQPGGISYVPRQRGRIHLKSSSAHCKQKRGRASSGSGPGAPVLPATTREQGLRDEFGEDDRSPAPSSTTPGEQPRDKTTVYNSPDGTPSTTVSPAYAAQQATHNGTYVQFMKPKFARAPIKDAGRVAYLGESSNLSLLVHDRYGTTDTVHYPLPENVRGAKARVNELDNMEIEILHQRGAFLLPPRALCDELVDAFFKWVAPVVPVINRSRFMRQYRDPKNPPSLLLLQAILLAGSRVCTNPQLMDANGSTTPAAMTFYKRAKALFDANYEDDRVTIVQSTILMGWYWEGPEDVTKNVFYWSRVGIVVAQGSGMHRSVEGSQLSKSDKRLWKRIWWSLFSRDRSVAVALGRPVAINPEDSDVEMITEDDFIEDEPDRPAEYPPDPVHVHFFINYVKLCEIMGLVLSQQYSVASKFRRSNAIDLTHSDMALADWLQNCPPDVMWDKTRHHFWAALLHSNYYTTLCLLHRAHMPPAGSPKANNANGFEEHAYPSRTIAYQAAAMITSIIENLRAHDEIRYTPAFIVYSLFSALIMHVYQMRSSNKSIVSATEQRLQICMDALKEVSKVWLVAKMVHTLFESILGNKHLEERLQKAAGKRHQKNKPSMPQTQPQPPPKPAQDAQKRKFDDMDLSFPHVNGPPAPQVSYERSRPQTPAVTPSRDLPQVSQMPQITHGSPQMSRQNNDAFMGPSRSGTRPTTPFNPSYSYPGTPPELFLVTRQSPNISQELWQNFQPDQLFPAESNLHIQQASPTQNHSVVDPSLARQTMAMHPANAELGPQSVPPQQMHGGVSMPGFDHNNPQAWAQQIDMMQQNQQNASGDDNWSNSSNGRQNPIVPTTLNVEDWFNFFGFNGEGAETFQNALFHAGLQ
ncbi:Transcriptional activator of fatty acid utilization [Kalmusia sp. IMI 367209]|nr:Transcriptional activator of fatty acid utilization [Kalmusia sp. IMI 367209]